MIINCIIGSKVPAILPDWAYFVKWWIYIGKALLPTRQLHSGFKLKILPSRADLAPSNFKSAFFFSNARTKTKPFPKVFWENF